MARRVGVRVVGVYRLLLSDKTRRVNAAFAGLGSTRRILLGDTLLDGFTHDEIEVVMAHEMGHYRHRDLWRLLIVNGVFVFGSFLLADGLLRRWVLAFPGLGLRGINDIAALPALLLTIGAVFVLLMPVSHAYARRRERAADDFALEITDNPDAFVSAMRRLGDHNLADPDPHPLVEFFLHSHPSIGRRIRRAEAWQAGTAES
jgi:STE24 endopeptidase